MALMASSSLRPLGTVIDMAMIAAVDDAQGLDKIWESTTVQNDVADELDQSNCQVSPFRVLVGMLSP